MTGQSFIEKTGILSARKKILLLTCGYSSLFSSQTQTRETQPPRSRHSCRLRGWGVRGMKWTRHEKLNVKIHGPCWKWRVKRPGFVLGQKRNTLYAKFVVESLPNKEAEDKISNATAIRRTGHQTIASKASSRYSGQPQNNNRQSTLHVHEGSKGGLWDCLVTGPTLWLVFFNGNGWMLRVCVWVCVFVSGFVGTGKKKEAAAEESRLKVQRFWQMRHHLVAKLVAVVSRHVHQPAVSSPLQLLNQGQRTPLRLWNSRQHDGVGRGGRVVEEATHSVLEISAEQFHFADLVDNVEKRVVALHRLRRRLRDKMYHILIHVKVHNAS